jgi:hypothetical protein
VRVWVGNVALQSYGLMHILKLAEGEEYFIDKRCLIAYSGRVKPRRVPTKSHSGAQGVSSELEVEDVGQSDARSLLQILQKWAWQKVRQVTTDPYTRTRQWILGQDQVLPCLLPSIHNLFICSCI